MRNQKEEQLVSQIEKMGIPIEKSNGNNQHRINNNNSNQQGNNTSEKQGITSNMEFDEDSKEEEYAETR